MPEPLRAASEKSDLCQGRIWDGCGGDITECGKPATNTINSVRYCAACAAKLSIRSQSTSDHGLKKIGELQAENACLELRIESAERELNELKSKKIPANGMEVYDFGEFQRSPKEKLDTPFAAMSMYRDLQNQVSHLAQYAEINGRADHYVKSLDTLMYVLKDSLYKAMVIREAICGSKTREEFEEKEQAEKRLEQEVRNGKASG